MLITERPFTSSDDNLSVDLANVICGVMSGMGFLWLTGLVALGVALHFLLSRRYIDTDAYTADFGVNDDDHSDR